MKIIVYVGTGGVGKTSVAAATALTQSRAGAKSLVLTIDPANRLRTALGLEEGVLEQRVSSAGAKGELWAAALDVNSTLDEAVRLHAKPGDHERILTHPIYRTITHSLPGMQELMAVERLDQLIERGFEHIVIDTAPSRHAFEAFDKPEILAGLSGSGRGRLAGAYHLAENVGLTMLGRGAVDIYCKVESILGAGMVRQLLDFYELFSPVAEGYSGRARRTVALLRDPGVTQFRVVTVPSKAFRDARFFIEELHRRKFALGMLCVNRAWRHTQPEAVPDGLAAELLDWHRSIKASHLGAIGKVRQTLGCRIGEIRILNELPRDIDGLESLGLLADQLEPSSSTAK